MHHICQYNTRLLILGLLMLFNQMIRCNIRTFHILEEVKKGTKIVNLGKLFGITKETNSILTISDNQAKGVEYFTINRQTLDLEVASPPDRDSTCSNSQIQCYIPLLILHGKVSESQYDSITIEILDINDNAPVFPHKSFRISIPENTNVNQIISDRTSLRLPQAVDKDTKENGVKLYRLDGTDSISFKVEMDYKGPRLGLMEKIDREIKGEYRFTLLAIDGGSPPNTGTLSIIIDVEDINDNKPKFLQTQYKVNIDEDTPVDTTILVMHAVDLDANENGQLGFKFTEVSNSEELLAQRYFKVTHYNATSCSISINFKIDCKDIPRDVLEFFVEVYDHGNPRYSSSALVEVTINDVNNNPPLINVQYLSSTSNSKRGKLKENHAQAMIAHVTVKDLDRSIGNEISCKTNDSRFHLNKIPTIQPFNSQINQYPVSIYKISNNIIIDREDVSSIDFLLICYDNIHKRPNNRYRQQKSNRIIQLTSTVLISVDILDENDESPHFSPPEIKFFLPENIPNQNMIDSRKSYRLGYVKAVDRDEGLNAKIEYSILINNKDRFKIQKDTGALYATESFDREAVTEVMLTVQAKDCPQFGPRKSSTVDVKIIITDNNDNSPKFVDHAYHFGVSENVDHAVVGKVEAHDDDEGENGRIQYRIFKVNHSPSSKLLAYSDFNSFHVDGNSGVIRLRKRLDREACAHYDLVIHAVDNPFKSGGSSIQNTATVHVAVTVQDQNDNRPLISSPKNNQEFYIDPDRASAGHPIFTVKASDIDFGNNATIRFELLYGNNELFELDREAGLCYLRESLSSRQHQRQRSYTLQVRAYDLGTPVSLNSSVNVRIIHSSRPPRLNSGAGADQRNMAAPGHGAGSLGGSGGSGFLSAFSVSDRTLVVILGTIFVLLILITSLLVAFIRYRRVLWSRFSKKPPDYSQGTVLQNYGNNKLQDDTEDSRAINESEKYHNIFPGVSQNKEKVPTELRRNQSSGYSDYGTLIHQRMATAVGGGQTFYNPNIPTFEQEYQALGGAYPSMEATYQLPTSHIIINEPRHHSLCSSMSPRLLHNPHLTPTLRRMTSTATSDNSQIISNISSNNNINNNSNNMTNIAASNIANNTNVISSNSNCSSNNNNNNNNNNISSSSNAQLENNNSNNNQTTPNIASEKKPTEGYRDLQFSNSVTTSNNTNSFVMKNLKATDSSPKKSVFGSFV